MSEGAANLILQSLSQDEYDSLPENLRTKIESCVNEHLENFMSSRAIFETTRKSNDDKIQTLTEQINLLGQERDEIKSEVTSLKDELAEVQLNLEAAKNDNAKLEETIKKLEGECLEYRRQRDLAVDERNEAMEMVERRNNEVRRLQEDVASLGGQLQAAVAARCEALANADELAGLRLSLEYKEKRLDQERGLMNQQIQSLTEDLAKHTEDMTTMRREHTNTLLSLRSQLAEKTEELKIANSTNAQLSESNKTLNLKVETLSQKLVGQCESETRMNDSYREEIKAQSKLAELYKGISDELTAKNEELTNAVIELQRELKEASQQYGELEAKLKEREVALEVTTEKKNLCIQELKKELEHANELIEAVKQQSLEKAVESLSPAAAATSRLLKSGLTLTQLYMQYAETAEQLMLEKQENQRLSHTISTIMHEIEQKAPVLKKQREDYDYAMTTVETLTARMDEMEVETSRLRAANLEAEKASTHFKRENKRLQETINDLGRQVCYLLKEVEESRGNNVPMTTSPGRTTENLSTSSQVISKHLVTFKDIQEMQKQNQKLLSALRELSEKQEQAEQEKESQVAEQLEGKLRVAEQRVAALLESEAHYVKVVEIVKGQREMYRTLFQQQVAGLPHAKIEELERSMESDQSSVPGTPDTNKPPTPAQPPASSALQLKLDMVEQKLKEKTEELRQLQEDFATYRKEKQTNDRMVSESLDKAREEARALAVSKSELAARFEFAEEKFRVLKANADAYKTQIQALEKKNNNYSVTIGKHEQSITHLKDECVAANKKLNRAEIMLENLRREHQILKESEARLQREKESTERQSSGQAMLMANLEMIKNSFERAETDGRLRLEAKVEEAQKECSALRRRLQEEQDRFRERTDALERAAATARARLEEEREVEHGLRGALEAARQELRQAKEAVDQLSTRVRTTEHKVVPDPNTEKRASLLEQQLAEKDGELACLRDQLQAARRHGQELAELSATLEKQLGEVKAAHDRHREEADTRLKTLSAKEVEMKKAIADLENRVTCLSATAQQDGQQAELSSATAQLAALSVEVATLRQELGVARQACQAAEEKYSHEMMLHADDMQATTKVKKELGEVSARVEALESEREAAVEALRLGRESWAATEAALHNQVSELTSRLTDLDKQNSLLHEQLQELGLKVAVVTASGSQANTSLETSMEDDMRSSDQLLQVLKYIRREKSIAVAEADALRAETLRLRAQVELQSRQLAEAREMLEAERSESQLSTTTASKHEELLRKVDTLNALTDSNRLLRDERDRLAERVATLEQKLAAVDTDVVAPFKEQLTKLNSQVDQLSTENTALKAEAVRWRSRANALIEKQNKNSPEDFKRLTTEKENLTKQVAALTEELKTIKSEKSKLEEQLSSVRREKDSLGESLAQVRSELAAARAELEKKAEELAKVSQDFVAQEAQLTDIKNKELQIRQIAKKYKTQYQDLVRRGEEEEKKKKEVVVMSLEEQEKLKEEGRQEAERTHSDRVKQLTEQVTTTQVEATNLRKENEQLRASNADKEERAKVLLKNARARIMLLTEEKRKLATENTELKNKVDTLDRSKDDSDVRQRRAEKEKADLMAENDRLKREVELLTQRATLLQRQVDKLQGGVKPSTSSGVEKSSVEPPTANIKPMAGPSSSVPKQQPTQHSVTVTPWRGTSETPFASIRPMSLQSRTVAVLPTTNQSSSSQAVLVPPQQQMVHTSTGGGGSGGGAGAGVGGVEGLSSSPTSSHTDYMPATSSGVVVTIRQATVPPTHSHTQHAQPPPSSAAESTQDVEAEDSIQPAGTATPQSLSIALVLPQPTAQTSQTTQTQCLQGSGQDSSVGSQQEQSAEQNIVSASNHVPSDQGLVSASSNQPTMCSTVQAYYRQEVEESAQPGSSATEQSVVASSEAQLEEASNSQEQCPPVGTCAVASSYANSSNTVTTSQAGPATKRLRDSSGPQEDDGTKNMPPAKRNRVVASGEGEMLLRSDGLEVEYQVPTSSQRDQEDDVILVDSDEEEDDEGLPDDGGLDDTQEFEEEGENEEGYEMEVYSRDDQEMANYDVGEGPDIDENITDQGNNEVEIIDDSNEVPNQSESSSVGVGVVEGGGEATSSQGQGRGEASVSSNQASSTPGGHYARRASATHIPPLNRQQQLLLPGSYEEVGDDSIVPSTPTLFVPRRTDGFGEAVSSPHVPSSGRFTFSDNNPPTTRAGVAQVASEGMDDTRMDLSQLEDSGTGRSVPSTPLQVSPQEPVGGEVGQSSAVEDHTEANNNLHIPTITVTMAPQHAHAPASEVEDANAEEGRATEEQDNEGVEGMDEPEMDPEESGDGVSSEGEKSAATAMVEEAEEGREAEASEASTAVVARGPTARRSLRSGTARGRTSRTDRTPIVWNNDDPPATDRGVNPLFLRGRNIPLTRSTLLDQVRGQFRGRARRGRGPFHFQPRF